MNVIQNQLLDVIAGQLASLTMQAEVSQKTLLDRQVVMLVLCTAADILRDGTDDDDACPVCTGIDFHTSDCPRVTP